MIIDATQWAAIRQALVGQDATLAMLLGQLAPPVVADDTVTIEVPFKFHADRLLHTKPRSLVTQALSTALGRPVKIACVVNAEARMKPQAVDSAAVIVEDPVSALSDL